jgi:hypothetical protein
MQGCRWNISRSILALLVFLSVALWMRSMESRAVRAMAVSDSMSAGRLRPVAEVSRTVRSMKLVAVEIDTSATSTREHESWRGDVSARVTAPVRLLFGTDLSRMDIDAVAWSPVARSYIVRVPRPERLATEVDGSQEATDVRVGWLRLRSRSGEYWLGRARVGLYEEARRLMLSPEDAAAVREVTREQVAELVRKAAGTAAVTVVFDDESPGGAIGSVGREGQAPGAGANR